MIEIPVDCRENALGMLRGRFASFLTKMGRHDYYVLDGCVWAHNRVTGQVHRAEQTESEGLYRRLKAMQRRTA